MFDAGYRQRRGGIEAPGVAAVDRAALDRGMFHPRHDHIDTVGCPAAQNVGEVDGRQRFSGAPAMHLRFLIGDDDIDVVALAIFGQTNNRVDDARTVDEPVFAVICVPIWIDQ